MNFPHSDRINHLNNPRQRPETKKDDVSNPKIKIVDLRYYYMCVLFWLVLLLKYGCDTSTAVHVPVDLPENGYGY